MRLSELQPGRREHELAAITALLRKQVVKADQLAGILEQAGSAVSLLSVPEEARLFQHVVPGEEIAGSVSSDELGTALREVEEWLEAGRDIRSVLDESYPSALREIFNRPPLLFVRGRWEEPRDSWSLAVVGARAASPEGVRRAGRLARELVEAGFTVTSGLARGIDAAAHMAALRASGRTVAVMGTGIDRVYPAENAPLAEEIVASGGCLISQFFPAQPPTQWTFPKRNVVMSGLTLASVVVEASSTSGAKMQARVALEHGRTVFLLRSLVERHRWAAEYVEEGRYGTRAVMINSTQDILDRLHAQEPLSLVA